MQIVLCKSHLNKVRKQYEEGEKNILVNPLIGELRLLSKSGLNKFTSTRPIFRARKKKGVQNQSQCARLIEKHLETIIFVF